MYEYNIIEQQTWINIFVHDSHNNVVNTHSRLFSNKNDEYDENS